MSPALRIEDLGLRPYAEALEIQREVRRQRIAGEIAEDVLLLQEIRDLLREQRGPGSAGDATMSPGGPAPGGPAPGGPAI